MIIIGLGNPGIEYMETRHNVGFLFLDYLKSFYKEKEKHFSTYSAFRHRVCGREITFVKPQTYMNLSGKSVWELKHRGELLAEDVLVVYDDVALPLGRIRIRKSGSAGGHNGMRSIMNAFGGDINIARLRIGVSENDGGGELKDYVLSPFSRREMDVMENVLVSAREAVEMVISDGIESAMSAFNGRSDV